ncbi:MAG TPA: alpha/beta fold hydrolase [Anaeromyxobacteraceae bacterium]|nr:alpha/beta fold hydrolase [Anaeromyxobacteraceae bacterium]
MTIANVNGGQIAYQDSGAGKDVVLLLHAFPLNRGMWSRLVTALEKRHRVIAVDYRGFGRSGLPPEALTMEVVAEDVRALLAHLRVERAAVAGLSMGGYVALELYRQAPGLFRGLALCDTKAGSDTPEGAKGREAFAKSAIEKGLRWVADEMVPKLLKPQPDASAANEVRALIGQATPAGVAAAQRGMARRPDSTATLATITCPTLVVVGEQDGLTPPAEAEKLAAGIKGAKLVKVPGAGHLPCIESPAPFNAALAEFFGGLQA